MFSKKQTIAGFDPALSLLAHDMQVLSVALSARLPDRAIIFTIRSCLEAGRPRLAASRINTTN